MRITLSQAIGRPQDVGPVILKSVGGGSLAFLFHALLFAKEAASFSLCAWSVGVGGLAGMIVGIAVVILGALIRRAESQA